jgi:hypothetical protein
MTPPETPARLLALLSALVETWRKQSTETIRFGDEPQHSKQACSNLHHMAAQKELCADELEALLRDAAPQEPTTHHERVMRLCKNTIDHLMTELLRAGATHRIDGEPCEHDQASGPTCINPRHMVAAQTVGAGQRVVPKVLTELIARWRRWDAIADTKQTELGRGSYAICATELEAALAHVTAAPLPLVSHGSWTADDPRRHFVEGAKWWEWHCHGGTMWPSDVHLAETEATKRFSVSCPPVSEEPT